ncbi:MAG: ribosomal maturation YjgA family protein [Isosphaeraceae bacterium]
MPVSGRNPWIGLSLIALVISLGLGSRRYAARLPTFVADYAGDTLWALAAFLGLGLVFPRSSTIRLALSALAISVAVELSPLYHARWIDALRDTTPGALVLGHGFVWSDLVCYTAGVGLGIVIDRIIPGDRPAPSA